MCYAVVAYYWRDGAWRFPARLVAVYTRNSHARRVCQGLRRSARLRDHSGNVLYFVANYDARHAGAIIGD